jgi:hypothetical protein
VVLYSKRANAVAAGKPCRGLLAANSGTYFVGAKKADGKRAAAGRLRSERETYDLDPRTWRFGVRARMNVEQFN